MSELNSTTSGWYYDNQLNNRLTSVTLHANRKYDTDTNEWKPVDDKDGEDTEYNTNQDNQYSKTALCRSIIQEDFSVSITNDWSEMNMGADLVSSLWNSARQLAPYAGKITDAITKNIKPWASEKASGAKGKDNKTISEKIAEGFEWLVEKKEQVFGNFSPADALNRALITQGTRFAYYSGTSIGFNNLAMRFTIFPTYENGKVKSVMDHTQELYNYLIGKIKDIDFKEQNEADKNKTENIKDYLKWQEAPGGFKPELRNVDIIQPGTLKLKIGALYSISNLVCDNANFNYSKQLVKFPSNNGNGVQISPLFCDITLSLRPVSRYSDRLLQSFVKANNENVSKELTDLLDKEVDTIKTNYNVQ